MRVRVASLAVERVLARSLNRARRLLPGKASGFGMRRALRESAAGLLVRFLLGAKSRARLAAEFVREALREVVASLSRWLNAARRETEGYEALRVRVEYGRGILLPFVRRRGALRSERRTVASFSVFPLRESVPSVVVRRARLVLVVRA